MLIVTQQHINQNITLYFKSAYLHYLLNTEQVK